MSSVQKDFRIIVCSHQEDDPAGNEPDGVWLFSIIGEVRIDIVKALDEIWVDHEDSFNSLPRDCWYQADVKHILDPNEGTYTFNNVFEITNIQQFDEKGKLIYETIKNAEKIICGDNENKRYGTYEQVNGGTLNDREDEIEMLKKLVYTITFESIYGHPESALDHGIITATNYCKKNLGSCDFETLKKVLRI